MFSRIFPEEIIGKTQGCMFKVKYYGVVCITEKLDQLNVRGDWLNTLGYSLNGIPYSC